MKILAMFFLVLTATAMLALVSPAPNASASFNHKEDFKTNSKPPANNDSESPRDSSSMNAHPWEAVRPEHICFNIPDPVAAVKWYYENLGIKVMRKGGAPTYTSFVADSGEHMMLELTHNVDAPLLEPAKMSHMSIHLAFMVPEIGAIKTRLLASGAKLVEDITKTPTGDQVLMLRDPWGLPIQFVQPVKPMLKPGGIRLEHFALNVTDSRARAQWFANHSGMKVIREGVAPTYGMFVSDSSDQMMLELYQNSAYPVIDFGKISHTSIHFASVVADLQETRAKLLKAGATIAADISKTASGDEVLTMRDPFGFPIQFVKRVAPMLK